MGGIRLVISELARLKGEHLYGGPEVTRVGPRGLHRTSDAHRWHSRTQWGSPTGCRNSRIGVCALQAGMQTGSFTMGETSPVTLNLTDALQPVFPPAQAPLGTTVTPDAVGENRRHMPQTHLTSPPPLGSQPATTNPGAF